MQSAAAIRAAAALRTLLALVCKPGGTASLLCMPGASALYATSSHASRSTFLCLQVVLLGMDMRSERSKGRIMPQAGRAEAAIRGLPQGILLL